MARINFSYGIILSLFVLGQVGCITYARKAVPAARIPLCLRGDSKDAKTPVNLAALRQSKPREHRVGAGDILGVTVYGIIPSDTDVQPIVHPERFQANQYYPPHGISRAPVAGAPMTVYSDGNLYLPLLDPLQVEGLTVAETAQVVANAYGEKELLKKGRERVMISLIKSRVHRILVMREDTPGAPTLKLRRHTLMTKMGTAAVVDLPAYENDVLHALAATGGMPGIDTHNCIWILRSRTVNHEGLTTAQAMVEGGASPEVVLAGFQEEYTRTKIPLRVCCEGALPFSPQDAVLQDGDIIYLEPRVKDFFYTGGMLPAGQFALPRDADMDVLEAIALVTGGVGKSAQGGDGTVNALRQGAGPGNVSIPPTRVIILRKLADGQQMRIQVDLRKAVHDSRERIKILPGDFLMLQFTPGQAFANTMTHWFNWNITTVTTQLE